jgi:hypothetical protein
LDPVNGRFRVTLQGFTVDHQTRDDALERDGVGDEVFLVHPAAFLVDSSGNQLRRSLGSFGPVFGQLNSSRPGSIQAGGATATGGLVSGDSYPGGAPWIGGGLTPTVGDAFPHVFYEGVIYSGLTVLVVFPSLWEWDAGADSLLAVYQDTFASPQLSQNLVGYLRNAPYTSDLSNYIRPASEIGVPARVSIGDGPLGLGEVNSRPIGMVWSRGRYLFDSRAVVLTYEMADRFAQNDLFGKGNGVVEVRYADDHRLEGRYTLYLKVERLP